MLINETIKTAKAVSVAAARFDLVALRNSNLKREFNAEYFWNKISLTWGLENEYTA